MNKTLKIILTALGSCLVLNVCAQQRVSIEAGAGVAASYLLKLDDRVKLKPALLPQAGITVIIPIEKRLSLITGLAYEQKGWTTSWSYLDTPDRLASYTFISRLHSISIPLELSYRTVQRNNIYWRFAGGMSYSFFLNAHEEVTIDSYHGTRLVHSETQEWQPYIGLVPDDSRLKNSYQGTAYQLFNPNVTASVAIYCKEGYGIQIFGAYALHEISAFAGTISSPHLLSCGASLNVALR